MKWVGVLRDRFTIGVIAAAVILVGVIALQWQVHLAAYDRWGFHIGCGTGLQADYDQAARADGAAGADGSTARTDYAGECRSAITWRRAAAGTLVLIGVAGLIALIPRHAKDGDTSAKSSAGSQGTEET
jgi:hypothetical protein